MGDLLNPTFNIKVGTLYLKYLLNKFGNEKLAILAYNAGEGRVLSWVSGGLIDNVPYGETKSYYKKIYRSIFLWRMDYPRGRSHRRI
mgnify:CR=1 FL=1